METRNQYTKNPQIITVRSSAGSGKTYRLAEHYLKVLLGVDHEGASTRTRVANIVAITFTNKASQEMRARMIDWMKRIILDVPFEGSQVKPLDAIMEGKAGSVALRGRLMGSMELFFDELLRDFGRFNVGTIDSFVNLTLKASALQLGLPPNFDISTQTKELIGVALGECLQKVAEDDRMRDKFDAFIRSYIDLEGDRARWVPKDLLLETITAFWNEEAKENADFAGVDDSTRSLAGSLRKEIAAKARELLFLFETDEKMEVIANVLKALEKCADPRGNALAQSAYFEKPLSECMKKKSAPPSGQMEDLWEDLKDLRRAYAEGLSALKYFPYLEVYWLFKEVFNREATYFRRVIPIEQLNRLLQDRITGKDFIPEIYYALAERYMHFLVDEFQDTSLLQWKNIEILAEEALSRGGTLFLVGDRKQAIYRWRGGRSDLVEEVASRYARYPGKELLLDTNYRSSEHIVIFNNAVFDAVRLESLAGAILQGHPPGSLEKAVYAFRDAEQRFLESKKNCGYVFAEKISVGDDENGRQEGFAKEELGVIIDERLRELIEEILQRKVFQEKDIAVLVRTGEEAKAIVRSLLSMNISIESEYTVNVQNNPLIGEIMSFLRFIDKPDDNFSLVSFVTGRIFEKRIVTGSRAVNEWLSRKYLAKRPELIYADLKSDFSEVFDEFFAPFVTLSGYLPLYDLVAVFLKKWEVFNLFPDDTSYLLHFLETIKEQEGTDGNNIRGFLTFAEGASGGGPYATKGDEKAFLLPVADSLNAIKVLTIHKAKGLQFPVVILPFITLTSFGASPGQDKQQYFHATDEGLRLFHLRKDLIALSPELASFYRIKEREHFTDELNNLYVALTRAEDELYIFLADGKRKKNHLADHLFTMDELAPYRRDNRIILGTKRPSALVQESGGPPPAGPGILPFGDFTGETGWAAKIRSNIAEAGGLTRHAIRARKLGDAVHRALSGITTLPVDDVFLSSRARLAAAAERIDGDAEKEVFASLKNFFQNPRYLGFFEGAAGTEHFNEKEIVDGRGNTFKIDRLIVRPDLVEIIDYKTGEIRSDGHIEQIRRYGRLISEIYPERAVAMYLLYTDEGQVVNA